MTRADTEQLVNDELDRLFAAAARVGALAAARRDGTRDVHLLTAVRHAISGVQMLEESLLRRQVKT